MEPFIELIRQMSSLFALESQYELEQAKRRVMALILIFTFGFATLFFLSIALFYALVAMGFAVYAVALFFAALFAGLGLVAYLLLGRRPVKAGAPFEGTRQELDTFTTWLQTFVKKM